MMQAIVYRREQPVQLLSDYPPQNYAPPAPPPFQGIQNETLITARRQQLDNHLTDLAEIEGCSYAHSGLGAPYV